MLDQVLEFFNIVPDYDLNLMRPNQSLTEISSHCLSALDEVIKRSNPDNIFVQGDTTTTFIGALCGYYSKIKISHIEAGLRSGDKYSPYPEEMNRILTSRLADYHFSPTERERINLEKEGVSDNVWVVGNTAIDALLMGLQLIKSKGEHHYMNAFDYLDFSKKIILITSHRRESFGSPLENIANACKDIARRYKDVQLVYPVHRNPNVKNTVEPILRNQSNVFLIDPVDYPHMIWLMNKSYLVLTDSGGIQEEAPCLGKPVLVMRDVTERVEGIESGTAKLVGTDRDVISRELSLLLTNPDVYSNMSNAVSPYGDGSSSYQIMEILLKEG